ncbi:dsDNA nuclease domain-containing protein [Herbaspirillum seropedicae]|uniref:dsDNA nuclease domain-containing protein n=1 Tax=Herbaspirillum seropedicae TaxID=964 RepID=UPI003F8CF37C
MATIEAVAPGEDVGRDTISRYDMQFQAAAFAALEILEGKGVDCVYCDYHDDFVVRRNEDGRVSYHFFQVKTKEKENHQYGLNEIFGLTAQAVKATPDRLEKVKSSFAGKLLLHGIVFSGNCGEVTLLSNVHFEDAVVTAVDELRVKTPKSKAAKFLSTHFSAIFELKDADDVDHEEVLAKLSLLPAVRHIGRDRSAFTDAARSAVWKYSEIDLTYWPSLIVTDTSTRRVLDFQIVLG